MNVRFTVERDEIVSTHLSNIGRPFVVWLPQLVSNLPGALLNE